MASPHGAPWPGLLRPSRLIPGFLVKGSDSKQTRILRKRPAMPSPQVATEAHYRKEFIIEMQAKGKIPKAITEATERHVSKPMQCNLPCKACAGSGFYMLKLQEGSTLF